MKHGGELTQAMADYGGDASAWLDLSTGINPWPWPRQITLSDDAWQRLPSRADEIALLAAARENYRVPDSVGIAAASGTQALIQWLPHLAGPGAVAILGPTYSEHALAWQSGGHAIICIDDINRIPAQARYVVLVNPNNPDGRIIDRATLARIATLLQARGGWLVIDEAFADVMPDASAVDLCADLPIVILKSFGKFYGLAGLRLGFAIAHRDVGDIAAALGPWPCSGPALLIGAAALRDREWANYMREKLRRESGLLDDLLMRAGFEIVGGTSLFRLARHANARAVHEALARERIWCRRFDWADDLLRFGLPDTVDARARLAAVLMSVR